MAKYTKRRHVRRTRKHGKRRGTRRHRGGGGTAKHPNRGNIASGIVVSMVNSAANAIGNGLLGVKGSVLPTGAIKPSGRSGKKVAPAPISPKK
jgi:hypothetical protein